MLPHIQHEQRGEVDGGVALLIGQLLNEQAASDVVVTCLLYTSDAADE